MHFSEFWARLKPIRLLLLDIDGVMTDGRYFLTGAGDESKGYNAQDGHGIRMLQRQGIRVGLLSGRISEAVLRYAQGLDISIVVQRSFQKGPDYTKILTEHQFKDPEVAYMGDDVVDLPVLERCGFPVSTPDAEPWIRRRVCYVTRRRAGEGAVREVADLLLKAQGKWEIEMKRYLGLGS